MTHSRKPGDTEQSEKEYLVTAIFRAQAWVSSSSTMDTIEISIFLHLRKIHPSYVIVSKKQVKRLDQGNSRSTVNTIETTES